MYSYIRKEYVCSIISALLLCGCGVMSSDDYQLNALNEDNDFKVIYQPKRTLVVVPSDEIFLLNTSKFRDDHRDLLYRIGRFVSKQPESLQVSVDVFSDSVAMYDKQATHAQAQAIAAYLWSIGVSHHRIQFKGYGQQMAVSSNTTPEGSAQNRRIQISMR